MNWALKEIHFRFGSTLFLFWMIYDIVSIFEVKTSQNRYSISSKHQTRFRLQKVWKNVFHILYKEVFLSLNLWFFHVKQCLFHLPISKFHLKQIREKIFSKTHFQCGTYHISHKLPLQIFSGYNNVIEYMIMN